MFMPDDTTTRLIEQQFVIVPMWVLDLPVSAITLRVYCVIRSHADARTGQCFPSRKLIADRAKCSVGSVDTAIKDLCEHGALSVRKRRSGSGDWTSNLYTVHAQPSTQVAQTTALPTTNDGTTGGPESLTLTRTITDHNHYLLGYTPTNALHNTEGDAENIRLVQSYLHRSRTRSRSI
jgi:hypothetical protein